MEAKIKKLKERIAELEAMVAMASLPSADKYGIRVVFRWRDDQQKIIRKLDGIAKRMKAKRGIV